MQRTMTDGYSRVSVSVTATETAEAAAKAKAAAKRAQSLILPQRRRRRGTGENCFGGRFCTRGKGNVSLKGSRWLSKLQARIRL